VQSLGHLSSSDPESIIRTGATELRSVVSASDLPQVLAAYNKALVSAFYVALGLSCASIIGALTIEWKNIKGITSRQKLSDEGDGHKAEPHEIVEKDVEAA
jgi:hypothetical protein